MANPQALYGDPNQQKKPQPTGGLNMFDLGGTAAPAGTSLPSGPAAPVSSTAGGGMPTVPTTPKVQTQTVGVQSGAGAGGVGTMANGTGYSAQSAAAPGGTSRPPVAKSDPNDPFAAMGGGVQLSSGEWVPKDHPLAKTAQPTNVPGGIVTPPPTPPATTQTAPTGTSQKPGATATPDPFAAMGGGVRLATGEWVPKDHPLAKTASTTTAPGGISTGVTQAPPLATPAPTPAAAPTTAAPGAAPAAATTEQVGGAYRDALLKMLNDNQQAPSINDPALKGQADAFSLAQTRAGERARSAMAERRAQQGSTGTSSGAFDQDLAGLFQQQGEAEAGFNAGLVGQELQNRRNQLMQAATLAGNQMNAQDQMALQKELANLDAAIKRESLAQQGGQFDKSLAEQVRQSGIDAELKRLGISTQADLGRSDLALRDKLGSGQLNLGLLSALMQNDQFGKKLGADVGMFNSNANTQALLQMLGQLG